MNADRFVGTWRLVSMEFRSEDGEVTYPFGQDAGGYIAYAADGYMNVALARSGRPAFHGGDLLGGSILEQAAAAAGYLSYAGRYEVRESTVVHYPDVSLFPNWEGGEQERRF